MNTSLKTGTRLTLGLSLCLFVSPLLVFGFQETPATKAASDHPSFEQSQKQSEKQSQKQSEIKPIPMGNGRELFVDHF